jgi:DNA-directed RNA polymerase specialized sigma24 family protein
MTVAQKAKAKEVLLRGNRLLRKWAAFYPPKKFRQFRNAVLNGAKNPDNAIPQDKVSEFQGEVPYILAIRYDHFEELGGRTVEQAVLEQFSAMAKKHARKWTLEGDPTGITRFDYLQEAYMTVIEAMYQYTRDDIELSTFVWTALKNRMINVTNQQGNMLCPLTNTDLELMSRYEQARKGMNKHVTFDEVVTVLGLSEDEGRHLNSLLTRVFAENQLGGTRGEGDHEDVSGNDYTGHRVGVDKESESEIVLQEQYVKDVFRRAGLTPLQRELMVASLDQYNGWMADFARSHINPDTSKPYSRMRITQVFQQAKKKVQRVLQADVA